MKEGKKIVGYKLKSEKYRAAVLALRPNFDPLQARAYAGTTLPIDVRHDSLIYDALEAGVMDIWFTPVYEQDEVILTLGSNNTKICIKEGVVSARGIVLNVSTLEHIIKIISERTAISPYDGFINRDIHCYQIGCDSEKNLFSINEIKQVVECAKKQL